MKPLDFLHKLRASGRYSFTTQEVSRALGLQKAPTLTVLHRLKQHKHIVSPAKGFYLIVPPEYQAFGCLPADMFVHDLMKYFNQPYYVGFLSAAQFYSATHQKPQRFQVVTLKNRRSLQCGRVYINFIVSKKTDTMPTKKFNTATGTIAVATPEAIAYDLVSAPQYGGGINNVATVLNELGESISTKCLQELTSVCPELFWMQRLGYLLELLGYNQLADILVQSLKGKKLHWVRLISNAPYKNLSRNKKWKLIVNTEVEPD